MKSEGKCVYCDKVYAANSIGRHLGSHLKKKEKEAPSKGKSYHLKIKSGSLYFLHLLIYQDISLGELDRFLRGIWLECCGHMSEFTVKKSRPLKSIWGIRIPSSPVSLDKGSLAGQVFEKGLKIKYEYDFGSTTDLEIQVSNEYNVQEAQGITLLSRNEPLAILCDSCGEPAISMCTEWQCTESYFCRKCEKAHAKSCSTFKEYSKSALFNSPRVGVCGYFGGRIDKERDLPVNG